MPTLSTSTIASCKAAETNICAEDYTQCNGGLGVELRAVGCSYGAMASATLVFEDDFISSHSNEVDISSKSSSSSGGNSINSSSSSGGCGGGGESSVFFDRFEEFVRQKCVQSPDLLGYSIYRTHLESGGVEADAGVRGSGRYAVLFDHSGFPLQREQRPEGQALSSYVKCATAFVVEAEHASESTTKSESTSASQTSASETSASETSSSETSALESASETSASETSSSETSASETSALESVASASVGSKIIVNSAAGSRANVLVYLPLGGGCHEDTIAFDTAAACRAIQCSSSLATQQQQLVDLCMKDDKQSERNHHKPYSAPHCLPVSSSLVGLSVYGGDSLMNGFICRYDLTYFANSTVSGQSFSLPFQAPAAYGKHDSPVSHTVQLPSPRDLCRDSGAGLDKDRISSVSARTGALVDHITLHRADGTNLDFGGAGGGQSRTVEIPRGWSLYGFYGGIGGHLHNVGIIVSIDLLDPHGKSESGCFSTRVDSSGHRMSSTSTSSSSSISSIENGSVFPGDSSTRAVLDFFTTALSRINKPGTELWDCGCLQHHIKSSFLSARDSDWRLRNFLFCELGRLLHLTALVKISNSAEDAK